MIYTIILDVIALGVGGWMLADGIYVAQKGEYIGGKIGPWGRVVEMVGFEPYNLSKAFIALGSAWLLGGLLLWVVPVFAGLFLMTAAILTLWYVPIGTAASVAALVLLVAFRAQIMGL